MKPILMQIGLISHCHRGSRKSYSEDNPRVFSYLFLNTFYIVFPFTQVRTLCHKFRIAVKNKKG